MSAAKKQKTEERSLCQRLHDGDKVFGTCMTCPHPWWPKLCKGAGLDFVMIDTEHAPLTRTELASMCHLYQAYGIAPIVRIPTPEGGIAEGARMVLHGGAQGVIIPYTETVEEVSFETLNAALNDARGEHRC